MRYSTLRKTGLLDHGLILAAIILAGGCGQPQTVLTGLVTLGDKPIAGADREFFPINGVGRVSVTETDASGRFRVTVTPSALSVTVIAIEMVGKIPDPVYPGNMIDDARDVFPQQYASHKPPPSPLIPSQARPRQSTSPSHQPPTEPVRRPCCIRLAASGQPHRPAE